MLQCSTSAATPWAMTLIKKYANRRLYDTSASCYITLAECAALIRTEKTVHVVDASSGEDITAFVMMQIIQEREQEKQVLPISALRQIISLYDTEAEILLTRYLEKTLSSFAQHHKKLDKALNAGMENIQKEEAVNLPEAHPQSDATIALLQQLKEEITLIHSRLDSLSSKS